MKLYSNQKASCVSFNLLMAFPAIKLDNIFYLLLSDVSDNETKIYICR